MPELPEVETVVRTLRPQLVGKELASVQRGPHELRRPWRASSEQLLKQPRRILDVLRRGKWIIATLEGELALLLHLGMTGRLQVVPAREPLEPHTHLRFGLRPDREELRFQDVRRFGSAELLPAAELEDVLGPDRLGPEPFDLKPEQFRASLHGTARCLKAVLLDQTVVAGVGNIYADEALFEARLHPARAACKLRGEEADRLLTAIGQVLRRAIDLKGSTIRNFVYGVDGRGAFQDEFQAYGRTGLPCSRCETPIRCVRLAGRSTHYCPLCQKQRSASTKARKLVTT
jgi:formamidopyrimidine-DNA glycosylase